VVACQGALVGLVILAVHVEQAADVLEELTLRRGQAQLLRVLVEGQIALVGGAGNAAVIVLSRSPS
jgi:hypothetical protein